MRRNRIHFRLAITITSFCFAGLFMPASAQGRVFWEEGGVSVKDSTGGSLAVCSDENQGIIVAWCDDRHTGQVAYAQRVDSTGTSLWAEGGVRVAARRTWAHELCSDEDGQGGAVVAWREGFGSHPIEYAVQRLSPEGQRVWGDSGVVVSWADSGDDWGPVRVCGGDGGLLLGWVLIRGDSSVLLLQAVDSTGRVLCGPRGRVLADSVHYFWWGGLFSLADSGALILWTTSGFDIRAQRVDQSGTPVWRAGGVSVCDEAHVQRGALAAAVDDGIVVCWSDLRNGSWDVYAQRLDYAGQTQWATNGVSVCVAPGDQSGAYNEWYESLRVVGHRDGTASAMWLDQRTSIPRLFGQRLAVDGSRMWDSLGREIGAVAGFDTVRDYFWFGLDSDTSGGVIATWTQFTHRDTWKILAQKMDSLGWLRWRAEGLPLRVQLDLEFGGPVTVPDGCGGACACWSDGRFGWPYYSVFAQRYGDVPSGAADQGSARTVRAVCVYPNPCRRGCAARIATGSGVATEVTVFDALGRTLQSRTLTLEAFDRASERIDLRGCAPGVYFLQVSPGGARRKLVVTD